MALTLNFRVVTDSSLKLMAPKGHNLSCYGSIQHFDGGAGSIIEVPCKVYVQCLPKKKEVGKFDSGKTTGTKMEMEIFYIKISIDGQEMVELDKLNYKYIVDGVDYLAQVRVNLGLG